MKPCDISARIDGHKIFWYRFLNFFILYESMVLKIINELIYFFEFFMDIREVFGFGVITYFLFFISLTIRSLFFHMSLHLIIHPKLSSLLQQILQYFLNIMHRRFYFFSTPITKTILFTDLSIINLLLGLANHVFIRLDCENIIVIV